MFTVQANTLSVSFFSAHHSRASLDSGEKPKSRSASGNSRARCIRWCATHALQSLPVRPTRSRAIPSDCLSDGSAPVCSFEGFRIYNWMHSMRELRPPRQNAAQGNPVKKRSGAVPRVPTGLDLTIDTGSAPMISIAYFRALQTSWKLGMMALGTPRW